MTFDDAKEFGAIYHHKFLVLKFMDAIIHDLIARAEGHDNSKFSENEFPYIAEIQRELSAHPYGTPEYDAVRAKFSKPIQSHYAKNSHHPEHYANGMEDMTLMDLIEMLVDWKAASMRTEGGGTMANSLKVGTEKYNIPPMLAKILDNTAKACKM